jgi:hypothetical protein
MVRFSKTIVEQHFKLLTGLRLSCSFKFLSSGQHTYSNCCDEVAAITVKLFDQTLLADVEMLHIKETVFGMRDGVPLMDPMHPCLVALAAASHWPPHTGCNSTCLQSSLSCAFKHKPLRCGVPGVWSGAAGASMRSNAVTVA